MTYPISAVKHLSARRIQLVKRLGHVNGKLTFAVRNSYRKLTGLALLQRYQLEAKVQRLDEKIGSTQEIIPVAEPIVVEPIIFSESSLIAKYLFSKDIPNSEPEYISVIDFLAEGNWEYEESLLKKHGYFLVYNNNSYWKRTITALCEPNPNYQEPQITAAEIAPTKLINDGLSVAVFEHYVEKAFPNNEPRIFAILDYSKELTHLQFKSLTHCGCVLRQWDTKYTTTVIALCCNNPNYEEPKSSTIVTNLITNVVNNSVVTKPLANDDWLQSLMAVPVLTTTKGDYYRLYFDKNKICLGGLAPIGKDWAYGGDYFTSQVIWLPENHNPVGQYLDALKAIPKPPLPQSNLDKVESKYIPTMQYKDNSGDVVTKYSANWTIGSTGFSISRQWAGFSISRQWDLTKKREQKDLQKNGVYLAALMTEGHWTPKLFSWDTDEQGNPHSFYTLSCNLDNRKRQGKGRPHKDVANTEPVEKATKTSNAKKKSVPETHQVWTGTVMTVQMIEGKSFDPYVGKYDGIGSSNYMKRLKVEIKTTGGERVIFWTSNTECRVTYPPDCPIAFTSVKETDWIKTSPAPADKTKQVGGSPRPALKVGDLITVSGKIKTTWRGATIINWVRLQELIPQDNVIIDNKNRYQNQEVFERPKPKIKSNITPYKGEQLKLLDMPSFAELGF